MEAQLAEEAKREAAQVAMAADSSAMWKLDEQESELRKPKLPLTAMHAALAALER